MRRKTEDEIRATTEFPFLFGRAFIEAEVSARVEGKRDNFPSFSEGLSLRHTKWGGGLESTEADFPSFWEGLSLRHAKTTIKTDTTHISLQFCRDYHWELVNALRESRTKSIPHRLGGVFIEVARVACVLSLLTTFPYILYGLSMRPVRLRC